MIPYTIADENTSKSPYSPGIVKSIETLLRLGFDPEHMKDGKIGPAAIPRRDLNERGFSVDRQAYVKPQVIEDRARDQMTRRPEERQEALISSFSCGAVRELKDNDNKRAFIIIDTAEPENQAHASIYSAYARGEGQLRKIRFLLLSLLQSYIPLETYLQNNPHP
jgi:hypothetical protein